MSHFSINVVFLCFRVLSANQQAPFVHLWKMSSSKVKISTRIFALPLADYLIFTCLVIVINQLFYFIYFFNSKNSKKNCKRNSWKKRNPRPCSSRKTCPSKVKAPDISSCRSLCVKLRLVQHLAAAALRRLPNFGLLFLDNIKENIIKYYFPAVFSLTRPKLVY